MARSLLDAVAAVAAETGRPVTCVQTAQRAGIDLAGRQVENVRAKPNQPTCGRC
jgi:hypothetical protein